MPKAILNEQEKRWIKADYISGHRTQQQLAIQYRVSRRTINRALVDLGVDLSWTHCKAEEQRLIQVARQHGVSAASLEAMLAHPEPAQPTTPDPDTWETIKQLTGILANRCTFGLFASPTQGGTRA